MMPPYSCSYYYYIYIYNSSSIGDRNTRFFLIFLFETQNTLAEKKTLMRSYSTSETETLWGRTVFPHRGSRWQSGFPLAVRGSPRATSRRARRATPELLDTSTNDAGRRVTQSILLLLPLRANLASIVMVIRNLKRSSSPQYSASSFSL